MIPSVILLFVIMTLNGVTIKKNNDDHFDTVEGCFER